MPRFGLSAGLGGRVMSALLGVSLLAGCGSGSDSPGLPSESPSPTPTLPTQLDPFAGLTYRFDLPADWVVMGAGTYDDAMDAAPDVADWLLALDLIGPNAFRAYEPEPNASGLRVAVSPSTTWNSAEPGPLQDGSALARLPGVTEEPVGDLTPVGSMDKAARFRWTQTLDWGDGAPAARTCVGYVVMGEFDPVNVVFSFRAETDRLADVEALMATFAVTGNPVVSLAPGSTATPSPTPFDKNASMEPAATPHDAPELEALLPDHVGSIDLDKTSTAGIEGGTADDPILSKLGKTGADFASATAQSSSPPLFMMGVERLNGIAGSELLAAILAQMPDAEVANRSLAGRDVTYVMSGAWPVWYFAEGEILYAIAAIDESQVAAGIKALP